MRRLTLRSDPHAVDRKLIQAVDKVSHSFLERDTAELEACFGSKKVFVSLKSRAVKAGYYTKGQLHFIFDRLFSEVKTREFQYSARDISLTKSGRAFVRAEWTYVVFDSDKVISEPLRFSLELLDGEWRIIEVRASAR